jgi:hypothetical protein
MLIGKVDYNKSSEVVCIVQERAYTRGWRDRLNLTHCRAVQGKHYLMGWRDAGRRLGTK